ncbi:hypothetical protein [Natrinema hispanicum]|nr:hypothetical protein [Natrinema hispanicum]
MESGEQASFERDFVAGWHQLEPDNDPVGIRPALERVTDAL